MTPSSESPSFGIYGATGVTGRIILKKALARGYRPTLIGRNRASLEALAKEESLPIEVAALSDGPALERALSGLNIILNAAGPFRDTAGPIMEAALAARVDYLDVNGEIEALGHLLDQSSRASALGVVMIGAAAFAVASTDGLAVEVSRRLGGADSLRISVAVETALTSPAVEASTLDAIEIGGREVDKGVVVRRPIAARRWTEMASDGRLTHFASAPLADVAAALHASGVQTIYAGVPMPKGQAAILGVVSPALPLIARLPIVRKALIKASGHAASGGALHAPACRTWVTGIKGNRRLTAGLEAGEGFSLAADIALRTLDLMTSRRPKPGAYTPASAFGLAVIEGAEGVRLTFAEG